MKITINGNITPETIETYLSKQKSKVDKINKYCKDNKINELQYKDSELEYDFVQKDFTNSKSKIETRGGVENA